MALLLFLNHTMSCCWIFFLDSSCFFSHSCWDQLYMFFFSERIKGAWKKCPCNGMETCKSGPDHSACKNHLQRWEPPFSKLRDRIHRGIFQIKPEMHAQSLVNLPITLIETTRKSWTWSWRKWAEKPWTKWAEHTAVWWDRWTPGAWWTKKGSYACAIVGENEYICVQTQAQKT